ncbi:MAG: ArsR family transcriptional regulator [Bacteroidota bacterium]
MNRLESAGMLVSSFNGNKKIFQANTHHPLFGEIHNILLKHVGFDKIIENIINRLGDLEKVLVTGDFSKGIDSKIIDLIFVGSVDQEYLIQLVKKAEDLINRKIRYLIYSCEEFEQLDQNTFEPEPLLLWNKEVD